MLLNYTTIVPARQSRAEIAEMLAAAGAAGVHVGAREVGFRLWGEFVRLKVHVDGGLSLLQGDRRVPRKLRNPRSGRARRLAGFVRYQIALAQVRCSRRGSPRPHRAGCPPMRWPRWSRCSAGRSSIGTSGWNRDKLRPLQEGTTIEQRQ